MSNASELGNETERNLNTCELGNGETDKFFRELVAVFYVIGIIGNFLAFLHLYQGNSFKNTKQSFMLKCLVICDFIGLMGMLSQMAVKFHYQCFFKDNLAIFCFMKIVWRFFGLCSGCVAFIIAVERYFALTKPFFYCKHITNGLVKRLVLIAWTFCSIICFAPIFGFGIYCNTKKCIRYRDAEHPLDVSYAFLFFFVGSSLSICMVVCNFSVTRIVYRSYRNMQLTLSSCLENVESFNRVQPIRLPHQISEISCSSSTTSKSFITRDEIKFINMINLLTASFVICWGTQMITIPIAQFVDNSTQYQGIRIFYRISDMLILIHFTMDPYIYVLLKTNYWIRFKSFMRQLLATTDNEDLAVLPKMDQPNQF